MLVRGLRRCTQSQSWILSGGEIRPYFGAVDGGDSHVKQTLSTRCGNLGGKIIRLWRLRWINVSSISRSLWPYQQQVSLILFIVQLITGERSCSQLSNQNRVRCVQILIKVLNYYEEKSNLLIVLNFGYSYNVDWRSVTSFSFMFIWCPDDRLLGNFGKHFYEMLLQKISMPLFSAVLRLVKPLTINFKIKAFGTFFC